MAVKIKNINVKDLGPIEKFSEQLGIFNLIYSPNEKGKTFLTEFIIRSLFKNIKRWSYVREGGNGKIWLSGLNKNPIEFSPSSKKKIESFWENDGIGLPPSIVNLLVAKGAEATIDDTEEGISKRIIKEILSGINILDKIDNKISKTVKTAEFNIGQISINYQGEGKEYKNLKDELNNIEQLFEDIESKYSKRITETYKINEKALKKQLEELGKAKRHDAYLISGKIEELKHELNKYPEEDLNQLSNDINLYKNEKRTYDKLNNQFNIVYEKCKQFNWLQSALNNYKELSTSNFKTPKKVFLIISGISAIAAIISILFNQQIPSIVLLLNTLFFIGIYIKKFYHASKYQGNKLELDKIKTEFKNRIVKELTDIATIETELKEQEDAYKESALLKNQLKEKDREIQKLHTSIQQKILNIVEKEIDKTQWDEILIDLKKKRKNLIDQIIQKDKRLDKLDVDETDYLQEDIGIRYSQEEYENLETELNEIQKNIKDTEEQLKQLKYTICRLIKDDISITWEELIENLRQKRQEKQNELKKITSKIIAGITVHKIISKLREEEDTKIQEGLESKTVINPLKDLTQRYNRLTLEGDKLIVSDDYNSFDLKDLSTGAREQVMLALRIGFSSKILNQDTLFLILDDAFQHSDWEKRKILIKQLANVAQKGWQIIYLTMDDNIRDLFNKVGQKFKGEYKNFNL